MANPTSIALAADTWVAVATNVTSGRIRLGDSRGKYLFTYRETGETAPSDLDDNGLADIIKSNHIRISHSSPIDVYIRSFKKASNAVVML